MRILLFMTADMIRPIDYSRIIQNFVKQGGNSGNHLFYNAVWNYVNTEYNQVELVELSDDYQILNFSTEEINSKFDMVIISAMVFCMDKGVQEMNRQYTKALKGIRIPIICLGVGAMVDSYENMDELLNEVKDDVSRFCEVIVESGGAFALRGNFTKDFLKNIGIDDTVVTGCPSFFQNGEKGIHIGEKVDSRADFVPSFNGTVSMLRKKSIQSYVKKWDRSIYMDQDHFVKAVYGDDLDNGFRVSNAKYLMNTYSYTGLRLLMNGRVKLIFDYEVWTGFLRDYGVSFSIGERIHGNIMALLSGIPAYVLYCDTRTREMAEYFEIPNQDRKFLNNEVDLYDFYKKQDYSALINGYEKKYKKFEGFLIKHGVVKDLSHIERRTKEYDNGFENYCNVKGAEKLSGSIWLRMKPTAELLNKIDNRLEPRY